MPPPAVRNSGLPSRPQRAQAGIVRETEPRAMSSAASLPATGGAPCRSMPGAAGSAANTTREPRGNPGSGGSVGGGLPGGTPLTAGCVPGNPAADLQTQLAALLTFNQQWSQYMPMLNAATSATEAADIYMNYFERPGIPAAANREAAANAVATACGL